MKKGIKLSILLASFGCFLLAVRGLCGGPQWALRVGASCLLVIACALTVRAIKTKTPKR